MHKYKVNTKKAAVLWWETTMHGVDPTAVTNIEFVRKDGARFSIQSIWDMIGRDPSGKATILNKAADAREWCRKHSLPSLAYIERKVQEQKTMEAEDPMGCPAQYI